ncbi:MAG: rRNA pseudouridine synthase, partial [Aquificae bacterium]|nr:rRNA pseudouridine synthase [Aquificota bacterium]
NVYIMLYKPKGYLSTTERDAKYPSFLELLGEHYSGRKLFSVGRLDADAEGLLLITDDGLLAHRLAHPRWKVEKEYEVLLDEDVTPEELERLREVKPDGKPADIAGLKREGRARVRITLREGRHHIVKRLFKAIGRNVISLKRTRIGPLKLDENLSQGEWRELSQEEVKQLKNSVKLG